MPLTWEQHVGLEPLPEGTLVQIVDPYKKTVELRLSTAEGEFPTKPPKGWKPPKGYKLVQVA